MDQHIQDMLVYSRIFGSTGRERVICDDCGDEVSWDRMILFEGRWMCYQCVDDELGIETCEVK